MQGKRMRMKINLIVNIVIFEVNRVIGAVIEARRRPRMTRDRRMGRGIVISNYKGL